MLTQHLCFLLSVLCLMLQQTHTKPHNEFDMHKFAPRPTPSAETETDENTASFWTNLAQSRVKFQKNIKPITGSAKNVIIFMGDGMSIPTLTATRMYLGNENHDLPVDKFPFTAVSRTYCVDSQVADSACSATAYLGGVKGNIGTIGVTGAVKADDCAAQDVPANQVRSIAAWFQDAGRASGLVTTARVTHASPAGVYAHTSQRLFESDDDVIFLGSDPTKCTDIARQLVRGTTGKNLNVIMGGGASNLLPLGSGGVRRDKLDLVQEWITSKPDLSKTKYVKTVSELGKLDQEDYVLGIFSAGHMKYFLDRAETGESEPTLSEMTEAAIKVLSKNEKGFFLFVEGGKIDMAHHLNYARKALDETNQFMLAVEKALNITKQDETLIVVTSDHAHTMSISGYPVRGNDILGVEGWNADDHLDFATLNYANGPSASVPRHNLTDDELAGKDFQYPSIVPLESETHGGDDVLVFANGPQSHLFSGVIEQNVIPHLMAFAACVGDGPKVCDDESNEAVGTNSAFCTLVLACLIYFLC